MTQPGDKPPRDPMTDPLDDPLFHELDLDPFDPLEAARRRFASTQLKEQAEARTPGPSVQKPPLRAVGKDEKAPPWSPFTWIESASLAAPLPPIPWVCEGLEFAPGAPLLWAGYGGGGKSMCAQWLALGVAGGLDFANLAVRQGKVLHVDYEQGSYVTAHRYQRMAAARGLQLSTLPLRAAIYPREGLNHKAMEACLKADCEGVTMCIIDSLAVASAGMDENSSEIRKPLDMLSRVSEATGCAFFVIHHARKSPAQVENEKDPDIRMMIRGSSGIFDACASAFVLVGRAGKKSRIHHMKARVRGKLQVEMELSILDTEEGYLALDLSAVGDADEAGMSDYQRYAPRIRVFLEQNPGAALASIKAKVTGREVGIKRTLAAMVAEGDLWCTGSGVKGDPEKYELVDRS